MKNVKGCSRSAEPGGETDGSTALRATERNHSRGGNERAKWVGAAQALTKRALGDREPTPQQLVSDVTDGCPEGVRAEGPAKRRLEAIACEARGAAEKKAVRDADGEAEPAACAANLQSLYNPAKPSRIDGGGGDFLLYDSGAGSDGILFLVAHPVVDFPRHST